MVARVENQKCSIKQSGQPQEPCARSLASIIWRGGARLMVGGRKGFALIALSGLLAACAQTPSLPKLDFEVNPDLKGEWVNIDYITAYGLVTRGINQCWLAKKKPLYKSEVETRTNNKQNNKRADIFIQGAGKGKKKGPRIVSVHLVARGAEATEVSVDNRLLDPTTGKWFQRDIRHFIKGGQDCPVHKMKGGEATRRVRRNSPDLTKAPMQN